MKLTLIALLLCVVATMSVRAAELSPTLPDVLSSASETDQIPVIVYLDSKLTMDDVYPQALALPMGPRREYVIRVLKERFAEMSPNVMKYLEGYEKTGEVSLLRPLWIMNAIRLHATRDVLLSLSNNFPEVLYLVSDPEYQNTLDDGWGVIETQAPETWATYGANGDRVIVGHKDSGNNFAGCERFVGRIWFNPGEDLNHNNSIDDGEANGIDDDGNGYVDDFNGWGFDHNNDDLTDTDPWGSNAHGTRTASVICSNPSGPSGRTAMAPGATLMELRAFRSQGAVFEASQYAVMMGANVISASLSFKQSECNLSNVRECPNRVGHRWVSEMELAAGLIHANSTGNDGLSNPRPFSPGAPSDCPPPAMTSGHWQQGGVSSMVAVAAYGADGTFGSYSGVGPSAWSRNDMCVNPRMPWCGAAGTPSSYPAEFEDYPYWNGNHGLLKPDITSPTTVEAVSGSCGQGSINGTSGATPHVGGALAVIYSAFPGITPEEAYRVLVNGALDAGDPGPDSTWGFGKLRLLAAVQRGDDTLGSVAGTVQASQGGALESVRVTVSGAQPVWTNSAGEYELYLRPGTYTGAFEKFGYQTVQRNINIVAGEVEDGNLTLGVGQAAMVEFTVHNSHGEAASNVSVRHPLSGLVALTDGSGHCTFGTMFNGVQEFVIGENTESFETLTTTPDLTAGNNSLTVDLVNSTYANPTASDAYGYIAYDDLDEHGPTYDWVELTQGLGTNLNLSGDACVNQTLPFNLMFYGAQSNEIAICANGHIEVGTTGSQDWSRWPIPTADLPNNYISVMWQDLRPELGGGVWYYYDAANHRAIVQWDDAPEYFDTGRATFQVHIYDPAFNDDERGNSVIEIHFAHYQGQIESSTGIENADGTVGLQYAFQLQYADGAAPIRTGRSIRFTTDEFEAVDGEPVGMPNEFALLQNYPNPFNSQTTFRFNIPQAGQVALKLYDITGRETATLFDGVKQAGVHAVSFDATGLATGIYFARMEANGKIVGAKKVLYLK